MNCEHFDRVVFWEDFSYDVKQTLTCNTLTKDDQSDDHSTLFGQDCFDYFTATEVACTLEMKRGNLFNFDTDVSTPALCHFWFFLALPITRMVTLLTTKTLRATDFPFMGAGLPVNLSLSARSALNWLLFSQGLAEVDGQGDPTSPIVLLAFKLTHNTVIEGFASGNFGIWNRRYLDWLTTVWQHTFSTLEWGTLRMWEMNITVEEFRRRLIEELAYSPTHTGFYHMPLLRSNYETLTGESLDDKANTDHTGWELVFTNEEQLSTLSSSIKSTGEDHATGDNVTEGTQTEEAQELVNVTALHTRLNSLPICDTVFVSKMGSRFHFSNNCKGLQRVTTVVTPVTLDQALDSGKTLCCYCSEDTSHRTLRCCTPHCDYVPTFMNYYCCKRCAELRAYTDHGHRCAKLHFTGNPTSVSSSSGQPLGITFWRNPSGSVVSLTQKPN